MYVCMYVCMHVCVYACMYLSIVWLRSVNRVNKDYKKLSWCWQQARRV